VKQDKARARNLWNNFRLTVEESDKIDEFQGDVCFACGRPQEPIGKRLAVDHNHDSGEVRGKLCSGCNPLLGKIENAFKRYGLHKVPGITLLLILRRLVVYLECPPATQALGKTVYGFPGKTGTARHRKAIKKGSF
jgi:hypothetical protein